MASSERVKTQPELELITAVRQVDVDKVESILQDLHNVEDVANSAICMDGCTGTTTALLEACKGVYRLHSMHGRDGSNNIVEKFLRIVRLLHVLNHGADPTITGGGPDCVFIPFHFAVLSENLTLIRQLLDGNEKVNQRDQDGKTALHCYCDELQHQKHSEILRILIEAQADVNLQDMRGRTPLHISCRGNHHDLTVALVQNGALATIKDNDGDCPLHMAAVSDSRTLPDMVDLCFAEPKESMELIIEALELTALLKSCPDPLECMRKATQLRVKHNIQKRILKPMECYGFIKEWETIEELEAYRGDEKKLKLQAVLARERIHQGQNAKLIQLFDEELISGILATCKSKVGKLLEHHLEICSCKGDAHQFLEFAMQGWKNEIEQNFDLFDTQDIVKLIQVAIKSMPDVKGYSTLLATITTMVMKLYRRNRQLEDTSKNEQMLANKLLEELFDTVPVAIDNNFKPIPLQHLMSKINFHVPTFETDIISREPYDYDLMKMLLESGKCKLDAVDALGNTLLHSAIDSINNDLRDCETRDILCQGTISQSIPAIKLLLEKGVYPNARNVYYYTARYMLPMEVVDEYDYDYLINVEAETVEIRDLLQQYEDHNSMTLKTKAAVVVSGLPYRYHLKGHYPDKLINFVNLHGDPNNICFYESHSEDEDESEQSHDVSGS